VKKWSDAGYVLRAPVNGGVGLVFSIRGHVRFSFLSSALPFTLFPSLCPLPSALCPLSVSMIRA